VVRRVRDRSGIRTGTQGLTDLVSRRVFADFVDRDCVTPAVHVERHFPTLEDRHLFRIEKVALICAWVGGATNDAGRRRAPGPGIASRRGEHTETDCGIGRSRLTVREVTFLCPSHDGCHNKDGRNDENPDPRNLHGFSFATSGTCI
jgi:hypothetical protein